jgi:hypothetical protein
MNGEQIRKVEKLLQRAKGCTMMELILTCATVSPSRRISDLRDRGWLITKRKVAGKNYHRFFGKSPAANDGYVPRTVWQKVGKA